MYVGEVNVLQEKLACLIKAAEYLKIKGLAVPDEEPPQQPPQDGLLREQYNKRSHRMDESPKAKRRKRHSSSSELNVENASPLKSRSNRLVNNSAVNNIQTKSSLVSENCRDSSSKSAKDSSELSAQHNEDGSSSEGLHKSAQSSHIHEVS